MNRIFDTLSVPEASEASAFAPSALGQTVCNMTLIIDPDSILHKRNVYLIGAERAISAVLWQPGRSFTSIICTVWHLYLHAPPLVQMVIACVILRCIVHRYAIWAFNDYQAHLDLGRGGSTCDLWGWWRVKRLKFMAGVDVLEPPHVPPMLDPYRGILWKITPRNGPRPIVRGIAPQRQINQKTPVDTFDNLLTLITGIAARYPDRLCVETSFLEGHTTALKLNKKVDIGVPSAEGEFGYEICHPHRNDGSLHMIMHPEDVRTVIEAGWGERHPLATNKWYWRLWYHVVRQTRKPVPEYLVLVYAPRDAEEMRQIHQLLRAAVWFATKELLDISPFAKLKD